MNTGRPLIVPFAFLLVGFLRPHPGWAADNGLKRLPMHKSGIVLESPKMYYKPDGHDPKPRVETLDAKAGLVAFKWIGSDGHEKMEVYQRPDAIDVIVEANAFKAPSGRYQYNYGIENLASSGQDLGGFAVQTFARNIAPVAKPNVYIGKMTPISSPFSQGDWRRFAPLSGFKPQIRPGRTGAFQLESSAPPGLVECRVHGRETDDYKGVREGTPQELVDLMLGYEAWPRGHTIGPVERLVSLSAAEKPKQLLEWLPEFERLGWMTPEVRNRYERSLRQGRLRTLDASVETDLSLGKITTEVAAIIHGMAR